MTTDEEELAPLFPELLAFDVHRFRDFAHDRDIRRGISWYRSGRITDVQEMDDCIRVSFDGGAKGEPEAHVRIVPGTDPGDPPIAFGALGTDLWDVTDEDRLAYTVASVLAYQAAQPVDAGVVASTADRMRLERIERARQEVAVDRGHGPQPDAPLGNYEARSVGVLRPGRSAYRVQIRSLTRRINGCTCPDFAQSGLGLCKHIAAALLAAARHRTTTTPARARVFRAFNDDGTATWGVVAPAAIASDIEADGSLHATLRVDADAFPLETQPLGLSPNEPADLVWWRLERDDASDLAGRIDAWADNPLFDVGDDVVAAVEAKIDRRRAGFRRRHLTRLLDEADGEVPGLHVRPFPYQWTGIRFLVENGHALLADDMGLGKTMQAIAAMTFLRHHGEVARTLVVCPTSLLAQWRAEIKRFTGVDAVVLEGSAPTRRQQLREHPPIAITTFDRARLDFDVLQAEYGPDLLIVDEAQRVKNWATKNAQYLSAFSTRYAFVLTGTPLENRLEELYALMQLVDPAVLGPLWRFSAEFCVTDLGGQPIGYRNLRALRAKLAPVLLRRTRDEVLHDLPERIDTTIWLPLEGRQLAVHDDALNRARYLARTRSHRPLTPRESNLLLASLQSARMACNAAALVDEVEPPDSPKIRALLELLNDLCVEQARKVVVFSEWVKMADLVIPRIENELRLRVLHLHGGVAAHVRGRLVDTFRDDPGARVFFSSDAGGVGLNLQAGTVLIHIDCPWNPAVLEQRTARVHRHGQKEKVQIIRLLALGAYEQHVAALVETKRNLFDAAISQDAEIDSLSLESKQLEKLIEALDKDPGRSLPGVWKDSAATMARDVAPAAASATRDDDAPEALGDDVSDQHSTDETIGDVGVAPERGERDSVHTDADDSGEIDTLSSGSHTLDQPDDDFDDAPPPRGTSTARDGALTPQGARARAASAGVFGAPDGDRNAARFDDARDDAGGPADSDVDAWPPGAGRSDGQVAATATRRVSRPVARARTSGVRVDAAAALWAAGQHPIALRLLLEARLDEAAARLGARVPPDNEAFRWIYAEALPAGAVTATQASVLALALAALQTDERTAPGGWARLWDQLCEAEEA